LDEDELMYWIFEGITFRMASQYELHHRVPKRDFRRILFQRQLELLEELSPAWRARGEREQAETLAQFPYRDE